MNFFNITDTETTKEYKHLRKSQVVQLTDISIYTDLNKYAEENMLINSRYKIEFDIPYMKNLASYNSKTKAIPNKDLKEWDRVCSLFRRYYNG